MQPKRIFRSIAAFAVLIVPLAAFAHTPLKSSSPAADSAVAEVAAIAVEFHGPVRLVRLRLTQGETEIPVGFAASPKPAASYSIAAPGVPAGEITVEWAAISADGHTLTDSFRFTVDPGMAGVAGN